MTTTHARLARSSLTAAPAAAVDSGVTTGGGASTGSGGGVSAKAAGVGATSTVGKKQRRASPVRRRQRCCRAAATQLATRGSGNVRQQRATQGSDARCDNSGGSAGSGAVARCRNNRSPGLKLP
ncbi:hypothetical protein Syun_004821 [Stephania yunnanensis]|uniref:Uncharacterized protein n=1 Tax=Stephania yunnanensis TaxID=152371 RepID=A0AAP0L7V9_9MAGN